MRKYLIHRTTRGGKTYAGSVAYDSREEAEAAAGMFDADWRKYGEVVEYMPTRNHLAALDRAQEKINLAELSAMQAREEACERRREEIAEARLLSSLS
jgi:hypothetical protein